MMGFPNKNGKFCLSTESKKLLDDDQKFSGKTNLVNLTFASPNGYLGYCIDSLAPIEIKLTPSDSNPTLTDSN
jgi:hypothetical protein